MHWIKLDLGDWDPANPLRLLMDGFTDYFSANSMYAAWQAGITPMPPYVEVQDGSGKWVSVIDDMGFPAGLSRTMVADLTGRIPPRTRASFASPPICESIGIASAWIIRRKIRNSSSPKFRSQKPSCNSAAIREWSKAIRRTTFRYVYEDVSPTGPYARQIGNYTRYGDVTDLMRKTDDEYVIFGSGDEVAVDFDATHLPDIPQPAGRAIISSMPTASPRTWISTPRTATPSRPCPSTPMCRIPIPRASPIPKTRNIWSTC